MDRVKTTLKQFVRDWSKEGEEERKACYGLIIHEIQQIFSKSNRYNLFYLLNHRKIY